jgi:hypothetical protein
MVQGTAVDVNFTNSSNVSVDCVAGNSSKATLAPGGQTQLPPTGHPSAGFNLKNFTGLVYAGKPDGSRYALDLFVDGTQPALALPQTNKGPTMTWMYDVDKDHKRPFQWFIFKVDGSKRTYEGGVLYPGTYGWNLPGTSKAVDGRARWGISVSGFTGLMTFQLSGFTLSCKPY